MNNKIWISIFAIVFAVVIQLVVLLIFNAPAWAGLMMFFVALIYFRTVMGDVK